MTRTRGTMLGAAALCFWSFYGVLVAANSVTPPFRAMAIVFTCATLVLLGYRLVRGQGLASLFTIPLSTLALGFTGLFGSNVLYVLALQAGGSPVPVNVASLSWPVFMVVIVAFFGVSRATWLDGVAMAIGFAGVLLLALQRGPANIDWPVMLAIIGALTWALYSGLRTRVPAGPPDAMTCFVGVSAIACWALTLLFEQGEAPLDEVIRLAIVGVVPVGFANLAWDHGARHGDPVLLAGLSFLEPIASTALISVILSKPVSVLDGAALGLVLIAVLCSLMSERLRRTSASRPPAASAP